MAFSIILRRLTSGISRSRADVLAPRRMITTTTAGVSSPAAQAPWLMIRPNCGTDGDLLYRFYCCAKDKIYDFFPKYEEMIPYTGGLNILNSYVRLVGSSQGWLALYDRWKCDLFLSDPTTYQHIKLPAVDAMGEVYSLVLDEREGNAIMTFGSGNNLALCSPRRSRGWTPFGGGGYESVVYSTTHRRLLCLTSTLKLEAWDLGGGGGESPRLDRVTQLENPEPHRPNRPGLKTLSNIVCDERSGELLVVLRHISIRGGSWERGKYVCPSVDFEVFRIDGDGGMMVRMEDSLEGMTIFLGINPPIAMRDVAGIKADSIYFADDERGSRVFEDDVPSEHDVGIFDLNKGVAVDLVPCFRYVDAVWFAPHY